VNCPGVAETPFLDRMEHMKTKNRYSPEVRERAVRMVFEHVEEYSSQWAAIQSIAKKIGGADRTPNRNIAGWCASC
jgi:transposase-like protein